MQKGNNGDCHDGTYATQPIGGMITAQNGIDLTDKVANGLGSFGRREVVGVAWLVEYGIEIDFCAGMAIPRILPSIRKFKQGCPVTQGKEVWKDEALWMHVDVVEEEEQTEQLAPQGCQNGL